MSKLRTPKKSSVNKTEQLAEQQCKGKLNTSDRVRVIITQKKNNSWVEDLDALERLNKCQRVFH